ncbi:MAG: sugar phosphate nucleotidyltransferase [Pirellulaceae bacterium]
MRQRPDGNKNRAGDASPEQFFWDICEKKKLKLQEIRQLLEDQAPNENLGLSNASLSLIKTGKRKINYRTYRAILAAFKAKPDAFDASDEVIKKFRTLWDKCGTKKGTKKGKEEGTSSTTELLEQVNSHLKKLEPVQRDQTIARIRGILAEPKFPTTLEWAVIPTAGWQAEVLKAEDSARLIAPCVDEALECGIKKILLILRPHQSRIVDLLRGMKNGWSSNLEVDFAFQVATLGLGSVVQLAADKLGSQVAFALMLPDDHVEPSCLKHLTKIYREQGVMAVALKSPESNMDYSGVAYGEFSGNVVKITSLHEKSNSETPKGLEKFYIIGRYVLDDRVVDSLSKSTPEGTGRIELTPALTQLLQNPTAVVGYQYQGKLDSVANYRHQVSAQIQKMYETRPSKRQSSRRPSKRN